MRTEWKSNNWKNVKKNIVCTWDVEQRATGNSSEREKWKKKFVASNIKHVLNLMDDTSESKVIRKNILLLFYQLKEDRFDEQWRLVKTSDFHAW